MLEAKVIKGKEGQPDVLEVRIPLNPPRVKEGGKMAMVASSGGFQATPSININGKPLKINLMAGTSI